MKKYLGLSILVVFLGACGAPKPVSLDGQSQASINQALITQTKKQVQQDPYLKNSNWAYTLFFQKNGEELLKNDEIVKTFYLAHSADRIIIMGKNTKLIDEYNNYFRNNGVTAKVMLQPVDEGMEDNKVGILFFHKKGK